MKIHITGAEVEKAGNSYVVIYRGKIVFRDKLRDVCIVTALCQTRLDQLAGTNVYALRAG